MGQERRSLGPRVPREKGNQEGEATKGICKSRVDKGRGGADQKRASLKQMPKVGLKKIILRRKDQEKRGKRGENVWAQETRRGDAKKKGRLIQRNKTVGRGLWNTVVEGTEKIRHKRVQLQRSERTSVGRTGTWRGKEFKKTLNRAPRGGKKD